MKKILFITAFAACLLLPKAYGQMGGYFSVQYAASFGMGDLGDYISAPSFRGLLLEYRHPVTPNILVGGDLGWNVFNERVENTVYTVGTESLSGVQYRYQNQIPIMVSIDYMFSPDNTFKPYAGLGIGTIYNERVTDMGIWRLTEDAWHFALKPEIGMLYDVSYGTALKLGVKYYHGFAAGDLNEDQGNISVSAGLAFKF